MRILVLGSLIALGGLSLDAPATAKEPAWCAVYRTGGNNCGFHTHEQCMATVSGIGGFCNRNPYAEPEKPAARREQAVEPKPRRKEEEKARAAPAQKPASPPAAAQPAPRRRYGAAAAAAGRRATVLRPAAAVQPPASTAQQQAGFGAARALILSGKYEAGIEAMKALGYDDHPDVAGSIGFSYAKLGNPMRRGPGTARRWPPIQITSRPWAAPARFTLCKAISPGHAAISIASRWPVARRLAANIASSKA